MSEGTQYGRGLRLLNRAASAFRITDWILNHVDPDGLRYAAAVSVWVHWSVGAMCLFQLVYRPYYGPARYSAYALVFGLLMAYNGYLHYRLRSNRSVTWHWLFTLWVMDVAIVSASVAISDGFSHYFFHLFYYPSLAGFAVIFTSFRLNLTWVTVVSVIYVAISLTAGEGLDFEGRDEKPLLARIVMMYAVVATVNLVSRFERTRWRQAVERERALQQERVELSQVIHDTTAQSAYMIGLGIDTARDLAGDQNPELTATLEATAQLSRSVIWELRHPINVGGIYEGRELGRALRSHASSFTNITSVPAEMTQTGVEPPLSTEARRLLFSIAHNALTNAYRHAGASRVLIGLEFDEEEIRLSVSDDRVGLPDDYEERGHGFTSMSRDAQRLGGRLVVEQKGPMGATTVACVVPAQRT